MESNWIDRVLTRLRLAQGAHDESGTEMCIMECEAFLAGEEHSDSPGCVCPVLAAAARQLNDEMTQAERDEFLAPMLGQFIGTRGYETHKIRRGCIAADYAVRVFAPMALRSAGRPDLAKSLEILPKIVDQASASSVSSVSSASYPSFVSAVSYAIRAASSARAALAVSAVSYAICAAVQGGDRRSVLVASVQMLREMIAVHSTAPKEFVRSPESLPCLVAR